MHSPSLIQHFLSFSNISGTGVVKKPFRSSVRRGKKESFTWAPGALILLVIQSDFEQVFLPLWASFFPSNKSGPWPWRLLRSLQTPPHKPCCRKMILAEQAVLKFQSSTSGLFPVFCLYQWLAYACCNLFNWAMLSSLELSLHESLSIKSS